MRALYYSILQFGYLDQPKLRALRDQRLLNTISAGTAQVLHPNNEVKVGFNEFGQCVFVDGRHRLAIAKILKCCDITANVVFRHQEWVDFHDQIGQVAKGLSQGKLYQQLPHPDLEYIPHVHGAERYSIVVDAIHELNLGSGTTVLDIGANTGGLCVELSRLSFHCTALENNFAYLSILARLAKAFKLPIEIEHKSILEFQGPPYDVAIALNIFHHFTNDALSFSKFESFLENLDCRYLIFQPHNCYASDTSFGLYRKFSPDEFAVFVREKGRFSHIKFIGNDLLDKRNIYLLSK